MPVTALATPPTVEPLALGDAKLFLRVDESADDALITALITAAREHVENFTRRALLPQTWTLVADRFPRVACFWVPRPPLRSVDSISYFDVNGASQTLSTDVYQVSSVGDGKGRVALKLNQEWPDVQDGKIDAVTVTFQAGYDSPAALPAPIVQAMRGLLAVTYDLRGPTGGEAVRRFDPALWPYRVEAGGEAW